MFKILSLAAIVASVYVAQGYLVEMDSVAERIEARAALDIDLSPSEPFANMNWTKVYDSIGSAGDSQAWKVTYSEAGDRTYDWTCSQLDHANMKYKKKDTDGNWGASVKLDAGVQTTDIEVFDGEELKLICNWNRPRNLEIPCCADSYITGCTNCAANVSCTVTAL